MKTTAHYLKIFCFLVLPILSYACPALAVGSGNENEAVAGENKALKEKMVRFFLNYLAGDETLYQDNNRYLWSILPVSASWFGKRG